MFFDSFLKLNMSFSLFIFSRNYKVTFYIIQIEFESIRRFSQSQWLINIFLQKRYDIRFIKILLLVQLFIRHNILLERKRLVHNHPRLVSHSNVCKCLSNKVAPYIQILPCLTIKEILCYILTTIAFASTILRIPIHHTLYL